MRQLLTAIRLAASFGGTQVLEDSGQSNALSVIRDIAPSDLHDIKDTLKSAFPQAGWSIAAPNITDGKLGDNVQSRFETEIMTRIDNTDPVLILQAHGIVLPRYIAATASRILPLAPLSRDILMVYLRAGQLCDQIPDAPALHSALPENTALAELGMPDICAALRTSFFIWHILSPIETFAKVEAMSESRSIEDLPIIICCSFRWIPVFT